MLIYAKILKSSNCLDILNVDACDTVPLDTSRNIAQALPYMTVHPNIHITDEYRTDQVHNSYGPMYLVPSVPHGLVDQDTSHAPF